jgi:hypothetical protein
MACIHFQQLNRYCTNSDIPDSGPANQPDFPAFVSRTQLPARVESHRFDAGNRAGPMSEKRQGRRQPLAHAATIARLEDSQHVADCMVRDVSAGGARLLVKDPGALPRSFLLLISQSGNVSRRCEVVWTRHNQVGVRFLAPRRS